ncbi:calcium/sodium antiporter [Wukongibacter baidiensis]|uniref:calcium/sodium antiporter n=1 Tax=Wukongibacter baidiensis TaxID=1723361 RepID=UPI003D7F556E
MIYTTLLLFLVGLVIIIKGGDLFVDASVWFATITGIPTIIIGATIVSLATTLPELFVSVIASTQGSPDMAIGNAVGSTICNIGLILSTSILFAPSVVNRKLFSEKGLLMVGSTVLLLFFSIDTIVTKIEGLVLFAVLLVFIWLNLKQFRGSNILVDNKNSEKKTYSKDVLKNIVKFVLGSIFIIIGAQLLVDNGRKIAEFYNVPEQIISLTLIALGTSLPELTTSITAIVKGHEGISVGNIIGANILNNTMILGTASIATGYGLEISKRDIILFGRVFEDIPQTLYVDLPVSLLLMLILVISGIYNKKLRRVTGIPLLLIYLIYLTFLGYNAFAA